MADEKEKPKLSEQSEVMDITEALQKLRASIEKGQTKDIDKAKLIEEIAEAKTKLFDAYAKAIDPVTGRLSAEKIEALLKVIMPADVLFLLKELSAEDNPKKKELLEDLEKLRKEIGGPPSVERNDAQKGKESQAEKLYDKVADFIDGMRGGEGGGAIVEKLKAFGVTKEMIISGIISVVVTILESFSMIKTATTLACDLRFMMLKKDFENKVNGENPKDPTDMKKLAELNTPAARIRFETAYKLWMKGGKNKDTSNAPGLEAALKNPEPVAEAKLEEADAGRKKVEVNGTQEFKIHNETDLQTIKITPAKDKVSLVIGDRKTTIEKIKEMTIAKVEVLKPTDRDGTVVIFVLSDKTEVDVAAKSISDISNKNEKQSIKSRKGDASIECVFTPTP